ncbi:hypothetical protein [Chondromyces crocatus]|uniref:Thiol:disulfide interchange protein DsbD N-terminal domain-containing protein n=1 Tax=Chondromyces crocatus TaxID=52 RepID=A0A0K1EDB2_CHOCO|nr:hypothetical protein [Chondromyces crocatus]AKT38672.1 uncharacterized protein CMC5_028200 [Chondromyces crocatus]
MKKIFTIAALVAATVSGTALAASEYEFKVTPPAAAKANSKAEATVSVTATGAWKINQEYPAKLVLDETSGLTFEKAKLTKDDKGSVKIDDHAVEFKIAVTPSAAGAKEIKGKVKFGVCDAAKTQCLSKEEAVSIKLDVK